MFKWWPKKNAEAAPRHSALTWSREAAAGLDQALDGAPVPALLKSTVRGQLRHAAEEHARAAGRSEVTAQDLMEGMLSKLPAAMKGQVEEAMKGGPPALEDLQKRLQSK